MTHFHTLAPKPLNLTVLRKEHEMTNEIRITLRSDSVADAIKIKAGHDKYFGHDSKINGNVVTCDRHDLTGKISQSDL
jgi:hypothetical protein